MKRSSTPTPWDQILTAILGLAAIAEAVIPPVSFTSKVEFGAFAILLSIAIVWSSINRQASQDSDYGALRDLLVAIDSKASPGGSPTVRTLTEWQVVRLVAALSRYAGQRVKILASQGDETQSYAQEFRKVFIACRWKVDGPKPTPASEPAMDLQVSINMHFFTGEIPEVYHSFRGVLDFIGVKCRAKFIFDPHVAPDEIVLWVGAKSPDNMRPENYPPLSVQHA